MRAILAKGLTASMIAGAALLVSACGGSSTNTTENAVVTDLNVTDPMMDGTMTDNMTAVDGAMGNDMMMSNTTVETNMMMGNTMVTNTMTMNTMATNAM